MCVCVITAIVSELKLEPSMFSPLLSTSWAEQTSTKQGILQILDIPPLLVIKSITFYTLSIETGYPA